MLTLWDTFVSLDSHSTQLTPSVDIHEEDGVLVVMAEVPGIKQEDLDVQIDGKVLTLRGERKEEKGRYHIRERSYGSFTRKFHLPDYVDSSAAEATLKDGILTLRLPRREEAKSRKILVKSN